MAAPIKRTRYAPRLPELEREALAGLEQWLQQWPERWVSISGGKDSLVALHLTRRIDPTVPVAFFDSGLEFPQTLRYVRGLAKHWGLDLHVFPGEPSALDVLKATGTWDRGATYQPDTVSLQEAVVERPLRSAHAALGPACVFGVRADESENRRMYLTKAQGQLVTTADDGTTRARISPAWRWSSTEIYAYISQHDLPLNPLYRQQMELGVPEIRARVGIMIDGWALEQGRWSVTRQLAPDAARELERELPALAEWR